MYKYLIILTLIKLQVDGVFCFSVGPNLSFSVPTGLKIRNGEDVL